MMRRFHELMSLARKHPFGGCCVALSALCLIGSLVLWYHLKSLSVLQHKRQVEGEAVLATLISGPQTREELVFAREILRRIADNLVAEENLTDNVNYFYKMEEDSKAHLDDLRPFNAPPSESSALYQRIPFNLKISGTFPQVAAFVRAIETGPRLASVNYFSFRKRTGSPLLTVDLNLDLLGKK